ncbi:hypothetical protein QE390_004877 [Siphonobacter sp. SORGH_AS 1065]|nr:hypothetical protein [Siphonobacter sp. SORGH_AS_1065]
MYKKYEQHILLKLYSIRWLVMSCLYLGNYEDQYPQIYRVIISILYSGFYLVISFIE